MMKIVIAILLLFSTSCYGQAPGHALKPVGGTYDMWRAAGVLTSDSCMRMPTTKIVNPYFDSVGLYAYVNDTFWIHKGSIWGAQVSTGGGGGGGEVTLAQMVDSLNKRIAIRDSVTGRRKYITPYEFDSVFTDQIAVDAYLAEGIDSVAGLIPDVSGFATTAAIGDTAADIRQYNLSKFTPYVNPLNDINWGNNALTVRQVTLDTIQGKDYLIGVHIHGGFNGSGIASFGRGGTRNIEFDGYPTLVPGDSVLTTTSTGLVVPYNLKAKFLNYLLRSDTADLSNRINEKLNASDTAGLSNRINLKLNSSDTAGLSSRINQKQNFSDTSSWDATISWVLGRGYATQTALSDTAAAHLVLINGKQTQLNGTGFVKVSGTTVSYDNSTYLTTAVTAVNAGYGITGGNITGTGTHGVDSLLQASRARVQKAVDSLNALIALKGNGTLQSITFVGGNGISLTPTTAVTTTGTVTITSATTQTVSATSTGTLTIAATTGVNRIVSTISAQSGNLVIANPTGTFTEGEAVLLTMSATGSTTPTIAFGSMWVSSDEWSLPTVFTSSKTMDILFTYSNIANGTTSYNKLILKSVSIRP